MVVLNTSTNRKTVIMPPRPSNVHVIDLSQASSSSLNPLNAEVRNYIVTQLQYALQKDTITSIVITGGKDNFSAGADLTEFSSFNSIKSLLSNNSHNNNTLTLIDVVNMIEQSTKPVVAAITGVCLGGGMELALACHYRVATNTKGLQMGLPEVHVGVIPGAGGTQRLPRLIGLQNAIQLIVSGVPIKDANVALKMKLIDAVVDTSMTSVLEVAKKWASWAEVFAMEGQLPKRRTSGMPIVESPPVVHAMIHATRLAIPKVERGGEGTHCALDAIHAACTMGSFPLGMAKESELFLETLLSDQGKARRHCFFATRNAQKTIVHMDRNNSTTIKNHPLLQKDVSNVQVAVIGAGTMGAGIAFVLLQTGYKVYLVDINPEALQKGIRTIQQIIESNVTKKRLSSDQAAKLSRRLIGTQNLKDLSTCQLVVEAVIENMSIKHKVFKTLNDIVPLSCIVLSNTSTLDIDGMAGALDIHRRALFAGWHFFSPAHMMKLVEIVVGMETSDETILLLQLLTKKIKKIGVVVRNCDGFCGNRMLKPYSGEIVSLLIENGATIESVDAALYNDHGMALGPFQMSDLAGNDIGYNVRIARGWARRPDDDTNITLPNRPPRYTELADDMVSKLGRLGQKVGKGWYDYVPKIGKGRKGLPSLEMKEFIQQYMLSGTEKSPKFTSDEIIERVLYPLVNEGFKILEEKIARSPSDIDVVWLYGYGWPAWKGGPMYWADHIIGLPALLEKLQYFHHQFPDTEHYMPSKLLERCVQLDVTVEEYYEQGMNRSKL